MAAAAAVEVAAAAEIVTVADASVVADAVDLAVVAAGTAPVALVAVITAVF